MKLLTIEGAGTLVAGMGIIFRMAAELGYYPRSILAYSLEISNSTELQD